MKRDDLLIYANIVQNGRENVFLRFLISNLWIFGFLGYEMK